MKTFTSLMVLAIFLVGIQAASAQTKSAAKPAAKPAAKAPVKPAPKPAATAAKPAPAKPAAAAPAAAPAKPALISDTDNAAPAAASTDALKVRIETNPITKRLVVRTNATGPTRVEVNDDAGRPVLTRDIVAGDAAAVLDVSRLPAGSYIVQCTSGERRGMRRVVLGQ